VATLNIKNMPDRLYRRLQAQAKLDRRSVAQEVTHLLNAALDTPAPLSILELRGLGKEHWTDIDAAAHVQRERAAWD
jgi:plasmid stability protein